MNTKEILQQAQHIRVLLSPEATQTDSQEASFLVCGLRELKKDVHLERKSRSEKTLHSSPTSQTFIVSLKGLAPKISRVQYEKDNEDLKLYFTLQQGQISQENLSLQIQNQSDLTIIVGDREEQNNSWKDAVLELLATQESAQAKLLGRLLQKLEFISHLRLYTSSIQQKDFQDTGAHSKTLAQAAQLIKKDFGTQFSYLFLFETVQSFRAQALLWTSQQDIRARFLRAGPAQQKGSWALLHTTQSSSQQLRHAILK